MPPPAVLITGCSSGIGRATAIAFRQAGWPVFATARNPKTLAELAAIGCRTLALDVTDEAQCAAAVAAVEAEHGAVGVLVNNAGYSLLGPLEELAPEAVRKQFDTNVLGLLAMCRLALPGMRRAGAGTIVNLSSVGGLMTVAGGGAYHATKWAVESLSDALRGEVRSFGVRVVVIEPGGARTRFLDTGEQMLPSDAPGAPYAAFKRNLAKSLRRGFESSLVGPPETVAEVIVRAASSPKPRTRYPVGRTTRLLPWLRRRLPDRWWDAIIARMIPMR